MSSEIEKVQETVSDIESLRATVRERHSDNVTLVLRFDSVLKQLINGLSTTLGGHLTPDRSAAFKPQPLKMVAGSVAVRSSNTDKLVEDKEVATFVENTKAAYEGFLGRDNHDILEGLDEETIRGVAKQAGLDDFKDGDLKVDGAYVTKIKKAIEEKNKLDHAKKEELAKISEESAGNKPTIAEQKEFKDKATAEYVKLFGKDPAKNLSGAKIQALIDKKKAEDEGK